MRPHCAVSFVRNLKVHLGLTCLLGNHFLKVIYFISKPEVDGSSYDIAIIKLYASISFNEKVRPICLAKSNTRDQDIMVFTAGCGLRYAEHKDKENPNEPVCNSNEMNPVLFSV